MNLSAEVVRVQCHRAEFMRYTEFIRWVIRLCSIEESMITSTSAMGINREMLGERGIR